MNIPGFFNRAGRPSSLVRLPLSPCMLLVMIELWLCPYLEGSPCATTNTGVFGLAMGEQIGVDISAAWPPVCVQILA